MNVSDVQTVKWTAQRVPPRRIMLVARALLVILLSLAAYATIASSPSTLDGLSGLTLFYPEYIRLTNCILAAICGAFLVWPRESGQLVGGWNKYVGLAFFTFSVQYAVRFVATVLTGQAPDYENYIGLVSAVMVYLGSYLNNILFLAAARILLNKNKRAEAPAEGPEGGSLRARLVRLARERDNLRAALPDWYPVMFLLTLLALLEQLEPLLRPLLHAWLSAEAYAKLESGLLYVRIPDAIFSIYCLSWFAYALWLSFHVRNGKWLARLAFVLVLAYAAGQLVYAANPFIACSLNDPSRCVLPAASVNRRLDPKVSQFIQRKLDEAKNDAQEAEAEGKRQPKVPTFFQAAKDFFDNALFAVLAPMKSLLFLPAFILYLLALSSVNGFRRVQRELTNKRTVYLSKDGILNVIGGSLGADELALITRVPGVKRSWTGRDEKVISEVWRPEGGPVWWDKRRLSSLNDDLLLRRAMKEEGSEIIVTDRDDDAVACGLHADDELPQTLVVIPIKFHGGVIGVLRVVFRGYGKYNDGTLEQLKFMAELIGPSVQDFRTMSAVDKLGPRLSRASAARGGNPDPNGDGQGGGFSHSTEKMAETLYDLLSPLSVGLSLNCGFTPVRRAYPAEGIYREVLNDTDVGYEEMPQGPGPLEGAGGVRRTKRPRVGHEDEPPVKVITEAGPVSVERDHLLVRTEKNTTFDLGVLFLAIPHDRDDFAHPTLAAYYLTRRAVASQTAHGIFSAARNALAGVIQDLAVRLNKETLTAAEWFAEIEAAVTETGLLWAVASEREGRPPLGRPEHIRLLEGLDDTERETLMRDPLGSIPYRDPDSPTRHIINLRLKGPDGRHLWLGVERAEFGEELNFKSPWKVFLRNLSNVAGTALSRIEERRRAEDERQKEEAHRLREADDEWLKSFADLNATVMHQLINMVQNMLGITRKLEIASGNPHAARTKLPEAVGDMKAHALLMLEMAAAYNKLIRGDGRGSCDIAEAAKLAEKLFRSLRKKLIVIENAVKPGSMTTTPSYVVALALASLIGNAADAIKAHGKITISAQPEGPDVMCRVSNDGPPIDEGIKPNLFCRGPKGKPGHSGWGLYLVKRSLQNYGGDVELSYSTQEETCFTLRLVRATTPPPSD